MFHGDEDGVHGVGAFFRGVVAGCKGSAKRSALAGNKRKSGWVVRQSKRLALPEKAEGRLWHLNQTARANDRFTGGHPCTAIVRP